MYLLSFGVYGSMGEKYKWEKVQTKAFCCILSCYASFFFEGGGRPINIKDDQILAMKENHLN